MPRQREFFAASGLYNLMWVVYTACAFALACSRCNTTRSESRLTTVWYTVQCGLTYHYVKRTTPYDVCQGVVELVGFEPTASCLQSRCSTN